MLWFSGQLEIKLASILNWLWLLFTHAKIRGRSASIQPSKQPNPKNSCFTYLWASSWWLRACSSCASEYILNRTSLGLRHSRIWPSFVDGLSTSGSDFQAWSQQPQLGWSSLSWAGLSALGSSLADCPGWSSGCFCRRDTKSLRAWGAYGHTRSRKSDRRGVMLVFSQCDCTAWSKFRTRRLTPPFVCRLKDSDNQLTNFN